jgi:hypothetical protein
MKPLVRALLRWMAIVATGGCGVWLLVDAVRCGRHLRLDGEWTDVFAVFVPLFSVLRAAPCLATAYFCFRRQYRKIFLVIGIVGGFALFVELQTLPEQLGWFQDMDRLIHREPGYRFLGLPFALLIFLVPILAAAGFYRLCYRLAYPESRSKTRATRWLVWLGIGVMLP